MGAEVKTWNTILHESQPCSPAEAFAYCERLARAHYENFPVGSLLVPKNKRKHVYSIYAFARTADDFADECYENGLNEAQRLSSLDDWEGKLEACYRGEANHPIFIALAETTRELKLPARLFHDLLSAFRQDIIKRRYANFDEVLNYCTRSANPIGRLVLLLFDYRNERLFQLSDQICTGLQLANFWQDVAIDIDKDRIYLPQDEMEHYGVKVDDLRERRFDHYYAELLRFQVERTKEFFQRGSRLPDLVNGRLSFELRLTWFGGMRILERIEGLDYDTLRTRPKITKADKFRVLVRSLIKSSVLSPQSTDTGLNQSNDYR
jgi:squalene synthase HpnC